MEEQQETARNSGDIYVFLLDKIIRKITIRAAGKVLYCFCIRVPHAFYLSAFEKSSYVK